MRIILQRGIVCRRSFSPRISASAGQKPFGKSCPSRTRNEACIAGCKVALYVWGFEPVDRAPLIHSRIGMCVDCRQGAADTQR